MKSIHDQLNEFDLQDEDKSTDIVEQAKDRLDALDDNLIEWIRTAEEFAGDEFGERTANQIKEHCDNVFKLLQGIKDELY